MLRLVVGATGRDAGRPQLLGEHEGVAGAGGVDDEDVGDGGLSAARVLGRARQQDALDPGPEPDRWRRRTTELLHEAVVAAATADRVLGAVERVGGELERGPGVVVQPAHEPRLDLEGDAEVGEAGLDPVEVAGAVGREVVEHHGCAGDDVVVLRPLRVQHPERVDGERLAALDREIGDVLGEVGAQRVDVGGPAGGVAHRVQRQRAATESEGAVEPVEQGDDLDVGVRVVGADDLGVELEVLAVPPGLRLLVAVVRPDRPRLPRSGRAVFDERPHQPGGDLGPQRDPPAALVLEVVHLLADDVGGVADPLEHLDLFDQRRQHEAEAGPAGVLGEGGHEGRPARRFRRQDVAHPLGGLELGHG